MPFGVVACARSEQACMRPAKSWLPGAITSVHLVTTHRVRQSHMTWVKPGLMRAGARPPAVPTSYRACWTGWSGAGPHWIWWPWPWTSAGCCPHPRRLWHCPGGDEAGGRELPHLSGVAAAPRAGTPRRDITARLAVTDPAGSIRSAGSGTATGLVALVSAPVNACHRLRIMRAGNRGASAQPCSRSYASRMVAGTRPRSLTS